LGAFKVVSGILLGTKRFSLENKIKSVEKEKIKAKREKFWWTEEIP